MKRYLELFFRHPIRFTLPIIVAVVGGVGYASHEARTYTSAATIFCDAPIPNASTLESGVAPGAVTPSAEKMSTLEEFLHTQSFLDAVARRGPFAAYVASHSQLQDELAADALGKTVTLSAPGPQILIISSKSASPTVAAATVQAVIDEFTSELGTVLQARGQSVAAAYQTQLNTTNTALANAQNALATYLLTHVASATDPRESQLSSEVALAQQERAAALDQYNQAQLGVSGAVDPTAFHVIDPPAVPTAPASRKKLFLLAGAGGVVGGLVITILALVLVTAQDRSVREEKEVEDELDVEVVGTVPQLPRAATLRRQRDRKPAPWFGTPAGLEESCAVVMRHLDRQELASMQVPRGPSPWSRGAPIAERGASPGMPHSLCVTSCLRGEGRTTITKGLASAYAASGLRVMVLELDFGRPSLARDLKIDPSPGVAEILRGEATVMEALRTQNESRVAVLVAGTTHSDSAELSNGLLHNSLVKDLTGMCDVLIADLPPLGPSGQAGPLVPLFSTALLVVQSGGAPVSQIRRALVDAGRPLPVVLNGVESSIPRPLRALLAG